MTTYRELLVFPGIVMFQEIISPDINYCECLIHSQWYTS